MLPANAVPERIQLNLASFFQKRMRLAVLLTAAAPEGVSRALCFDAVTYHYDHKSKKKAGYRIVAKLHPTSCSCLCAAHNLDPMPMRHPKMQFTGRSHVALTIRMCGLPINDDGECDLHREGTTKNEFARGVCCANLEAHLNCYHAVTTTDDRKDAEGVWIPVELVGGSAAAKELGMIVASVAAYDRASRDVRSDPALVAQARDETIAALDDQIALFHQKALMSAAAAASATSSDAACMPPPSARRGIKRRSDVDQMDVTAVKMLCEGGVSQAKRASGAATRLVRRGEGEMDWMQREVASTHGWMFARAGGECQTRFAVYQKLELMQRRVEYYDEGASPTEAPPQPPPPQPPASQPAQPSHGANDDPNYVHDTIVEYVDVRGIAECRRQVHALIATGELTVSQHRRADLFLAWIKAMEEQCGAEVDGPLGYAALPLECKYRARNGGGRIYA
mgnify:CR=1 FL=1